MPLLCKKAGRGGTGSRLAYPAARVGLIHDEMQGRLLFQNMPPGMLLEQDVTAFLGIEDFVFRRIAPSKGGDGVSEDGEGFHFHEEILQGGAPEIKSIRWLKYPRGAPRTIVITYRFTSEGRLETIKLDWFDKEATRLPEALWLSVGLSLRKKGVWKMVKIGQSLPLGPTVSMGARSIHAVEALKYAEGSKRLSVCNIDSPLVSLGKRKLLDFDNAPALDNGCFHFNLCNNIWGTNFPLWYEEDGRSRIRLQWEA